MAIGRVSALAGDRSAQVSARACANTLVVIELSADNKLHARTQPQRPTWEFELCGARERLAGALKAARAARR